MDGTDWGNWSHRKYGSHRLDWMDRSLWANWIWYYRRHGSLWSYRMDRPNGCYRDNRIYRIYRACRNRYKYWCNWPYWECRHYG
jgi:hypothetical protein